MGERSLSLEWLLPVVQDCDIDGPNEPGNDQQLDIVPNLETAKPEAHERAELA